MKICKKCNIEYNDTMNFCPECGTRLEEKLNVCPNCGSEYKEGQKFCAECGTKLVGDASTKMEETLSSQQVEELYRKGEEYYVKADCDVENPEEDENFIKAFECFFEAANAGHAGALYYLGKLYECGYGVKEDLDKSKECHSKAFEILSSEYNSGSYKGGAMLSNYYLSIDKKKALEILSNCAENGDPGSQYKLGSWYEYATGPLIRNISKAAEWYKKAADSGHADAAYNMGRLYYYGDKRLEENKLEAVKWFQKSLDLGEHTGYSSFYLGECYLKGEGVAKCRDKAIEYYIIAAEYGIEKAMLNTANYCLENADYEKAFALYTKIVKKDGEYKKTAQSKLDKYYDENGNYTSTSYSTLESKSSNGDIDAKLKLAEYYFAQDKTKSINLYKEVAETGNKEALNKLVALYTRYNIQIFDEKVKEDNYGTSIKKDIGEYETIKEFINDYGDVMKWFRMAADQGNADAMFIIGEFYYYGYNVQKDKESAIYWYKKAHSAGYPRRKWLTKIVELEVKFNKDNLRRGIYWIKEGIKSIETGMFNTDSMDDYPYIYIPSSVTHIGEGAFCNLRHLWSVICESPKNITVTSMKKMFSKCHCLSDISFLAEWDVSRVTSMEAMFNYTNVKDLAPLAKWNTSSVESLVYAFNGCKSEDLTPLAKWDTSKVKSMDNAFASTSIKNLDPINNWNVSNVESMRYMFSSCSRLKDISAISNWHFAQERRNSIPKWASSMFSCCGKDLDITPLYSWGLTKTEIYRDLIVRVGPYQIKPVTPASSTSPTRGTISGSKETSYTGEMSENEAIDKCVPNVFFIRALGIDITYLDGTYRHLNCGYGAEDIPSWSGTGFLLANGKFVTARHVVEAWSFSSSSGDVVDENMLALNAIATNGGKVIAKFEAISSNGTRIQFSSAQCIINRQNDVVGNTEHGAKLTIAKLDNTDYAYFNSGRTSGLLQNIAGSTTLTRGTRLVVLGFPLGIGANSANDINPIFGSGIVAVNGLQNGVILTTDTNYEQGNSGGPVFKANSKGELEVVGLVSAGAGRTMGFIVPIASIN